MLCADIAFARNPAGNPGVVDLASHGSRLLAIVDGWGSWSNGAECAARAQILLTARWKVSFPDSLEQAADDVHEIASSAPGPETDPDLDGTFHAVLLEISDRIVRVAAAGAFPAILLSGTGHDYIFKPRTLLDDYRERTTFSRAEIDAFPHKNVCLGPFLAAGRASSPMICTRPRELLPGESILVATPTVVDDLLGRNELPFRVSAVDLRDRDGRRWAPPVLVLTHNA